MNSLGNGTAMAFELAHFLGLYFAKYGTFAAQKDEHIWPFHSQS